MDVKKIEIIAADGYKLSAHLYEPPKRAKGSVLIVSAIGVNQHYYSNFAKWVAAKGFNVVTFDYRGMGSSRHGKLSKLQTTIIDWANLDCSAALEKVQALGPPVYWIGHSLGGQIIPFVSHHNQIKQIITIACGSGYWKDNTAYMRPLIAWLWFVVVPVAVRMFGYFPGKKLRKVGDLPKGVILQWRAWCLNKNYSVGVEGDYAKQLYDGVTTPILSLSFTDDEYMSARSIQSIHHLYRNAPKTFVRVNPKEVGLKKIGHFGFFKKSNTFLWEKFLDEPLS